MKKTTVYVSSVLTPEEQHANAVTYLEEKTKELELTEDSFEAIDELVSRVYNSTNILIGLREAIEILASNEEYKEIKLIDFLEGFYQSAPISKFYTKQEHEQNFKIAVLCSSEILNEPELLGDLYPNCFEDNDY